MKNKVLVYKPDLLPLSETFIKEQVLAYRSWHGVLVGHRRVPNGLSLDGLDLRLLLNDPPGRGEEWLWRLRRWRGFVSKSELQVLTAENAQIFHVHFGTVAVDIWPLVRTLGLPMVVTLHGYDINIYREWWEAGHEGFRRRGYPKKLLLLSREPQVHFIAVSEAIRQRAIAFGIPAEKITVCYIGVDTEKFKPGGLPITQRTRRILFVGRLVEKKGVSYLIKAFAKVAREIPDAELVIVGDGPLRTQIEEQALEVSARITFLGPLNSEQIKKQLDKARVLCLPSVTANDGDAEGFGLVTLEAQASGVPVITSARGGAAEGLIHGQTGFALTEGDIEILKNYIERLLGDDNLLEQMSRYGTQHARTNFDLCQCTAILEQQYDIFVNTLISREAVHL